MKLGEIRETLFQILTMISDEETKLFLRQDMNALLNSEATLFYKYRGTFKDLKTDFYSFLTSDINSLRTAHARDVTKEIHKPVCTMFIKESGAEWESDAQYPQDIVDPFIPLKTEGLTAEEIEVNELLLDAEDVSISFNYSIKTILNYLVTEKLLVLENNYFLGRVNSEPQSSDEESDHSIGNVQSDEDLIGSETEIIPAGPEQTLYQNAAEMSEPQSTVNVGEPIYKVNVDRLFEFRTGLASGKNNSFYVNFENGLRTALEEHYLQKDQRLKKIAKQNTLGKVISIEEVIDGTNDPQQVPPPNLKL